MRNNKYGLGNKHGEPEDHSNNSDNSNQPFLIAAFRKILDVLLQPVAMLIDAIESIIKLANSKSIDRQYGIVLCTVAGSISGALPFFILDRTRVAEGLFAGAFLGAIVALIGEKNCFYAALTWPFYFIAKGLIPPTTRKLAIRNNHLTRCMTGSTIVGAIAFIEAGESQAQEGNALWIAGLCIGACIGFAIGVAGGRVSLRVAQGIVRAGVGAVVGAIIWSYIGAAVFAIYVTITRAHSTPVAIIMLPGLALGAWLGAWFAIRRWDQLTERVHKLVLGTMVGVNLGLLASPFVIVSFDVDTGLGIITLGVSGAALGIICVYMSNMRKHARNW